MCRGSGHSCYVACFLYSILKEWNADIQMDLHDSVAIMLLATGLGKFIGQKGFFNDLYTAFCIKWIFRV